MQNMPLPDHFGDGGAYSKPAEVQVHGKPDAWIFKDTTAGQISLTICGECGYAEMQVGNFAELYAKYTRPKPTAG